MHSYDVSSIKNALVSIAEGTTCQDNIVHQMKLFTLSITSILSLQDTDCYWKCGKAVRV